MTRFREFAHSPYFNKHKDVANLVTYLDRTYPNFTEKKCHRETIFSVLSPTLPHDQKKLAIIFTYTLRLLEQFLKTEQAIQNHLLSDNALLLKECRENELIILLNQYYREKTNGVKNKIGKVARPNPPHSEIAILDELDKSALTLGHTDTPFLDNKQSLLDLQYLTQKLKDACELIQRGRLTKNIFTPSPLLEKATGLLAEKKLDTPIPSAIQLFFNLYLMLINEDTDIYENILADVEKKETDLTTEETKAIYNHLVNFCIAMANTGKQVFLEKLFTILKIQLKKGFLINNNIMAEWHYKNIVTTGLRMEEFNWVKNFIEKYKEHLHPSVMENAYTYNLANYHYHLAQFDEVLQLLLQVEYTDLRYNLDAKSLLLRTYYDMEEEEALFSLTDSFKQFLKRNKAVNSIQKNGYYNLLKFTRTAFRLKVNKNFMSKKRWAGSFEKLEKEVEYADIVFNLGWVREKVEELSQN